MQNRLRDLREKHSLTQEQLANNVGVSRQTIISIETGKYNPSLILAYKLAKNFNCLIEDVFIFSDREGGKNNG
ncbi:MAG: helix-turn-helix transcriptional regulator [bacterium]